MKTHTHKMTDYHTRTRQQTIRAYEKKLDAAMQFLGNKHVFHPNNPNRPRKGVYNNFGKQVA